MNGAKYFLSSCDAETLVGTTAQIKTLGAQYSLLAKSAQRVRSIVSCQRIAITPLALSTLAQEREFRHVCLVSQYVEFAVCWSPMISSWNLSFPIHQVRLKEAARTSLERTRVSSACDLIGKKGKCNLRDTRWTRSTHLHVGHVWREGEKALNPQKLSSERRDTQLAKCT